MFLHKDVECGLISPVLVTLWQRHRSSEKIQSPSPLIFLSFLKAVEFSLLVFLFSVWLKFFVLGVFSISFFLVASLLCTVSVGDYLSFRSHCKKLKLRAGRSSLGSEFELERFVREALTRDAVDVIINQNDKNIEPDMVDMLRKRIRSDYDLFALFGLTEGGIKIYYKRAECELKEKNDIYEMEPLKFTEWSSEPAVVPLSES